jgi:hypothetical protein
MRDKSQLFGLPSLNTETQETHILCSIASSKELDFYIIHQEGYGN